MPILFCSLRSIETPMNNFELYVVLHATGEIETVTIVPVLFWALVDGTYKPFVPVYNKQRELIAECAYSNYMKHDICGHGTVKRVITKAQLSDVIEEYKAWQLFSTGENERDFYLPVDLS